MKSNLWKIILLLIGIIILFAVIIMKIYFSENKITTYIKKHNYDVSIGYYNLVTGEEYLYQEDKIYYGASLIKTLDAIYLYDNGEINDSIRQIVESAIKISDNDAHKYLLDYIGKENLSEYGRSLGAENTLTDNDSYGKTTIKDQIVYWKKLYDMTKDNNEELKSYFINEEWNNIKIKGLNVMHKYGYYEQYFHDVGIVLDEEPYIIAILTEYGEDENREKIINDLSNLIYKYHKNEL